MARNLRSSLENRTARLKLAPHGKPVWEKIAKGIALGYRRNADGGSNPWIVRCTIGKQWIRNFAVADDFEESNGETILDFDEAVHLARDLARAGKDNHAAPAGAPDTVASAIEAYKADLRARGKREYNAAAAKLHQPPSILCKLVARLTAKELKAFRDGLTASHTAAGINRIICPLLEPFSV